MRYLFGFLCVCALGVMPVVGCSETAGDGGNGGDGGMGGTGGMPKCETPQDCDDREQCTADTCAEGMCEYTPVANGTACDETNECTAGICADGICDTTPVQDGTACAGGTCQAGQCALSGTVLPCTEQGIRNAIAAGVGPYTFDCNGPTTVVIEATIPIDNDVILDGEGNLTVSGGGEDGPLDKEPYTLLEVVEDVEAKLDRMTVSGRFCVPFGFDVNGPAIENSGTLTLDSVTLSKNCDGIGNDGTLAVINTTVTENGAGISNKGTLTVMNSTVSRNNGWGIFNDGTLTVTDSTVSETNRSSGIVNQGTATVTNSTMSGNASGGIHNDGLLTVTNSTVSGNASGEGGGIRNVFGTLTVTNSTVSGNSGEQGGGISNEGTLTVTNCTVSGNTASETGGAIANFGSVTITASIVSGNTAPDGPCRGSIASSGYNIESPGNDCGFSEEGDQPSVTADQLNLGPLADNSGPTMTHALRTDPIVSAAIDQIPASACSVDTDQRGEPRPETGGTMCDAGSVERQPEDP